MKKIFALMLSFSIMASQTVFVQAAAEDTFAELETKLPALEELLIRCESNGLDVGYERIDYTTIRDFIEYGREDISWGHTERAEYVAAELETMYQKLYDKLTAYRNGTDKPMTVKRNYVENFVGKSGGSFVNNSGESVYLNGYNLPAWSARDLVGDIEKFQDFGADVIQLEIVPNDVIYGKTSINGWQIYKNNGVDATAEVVEGGADDTGHALKITNNSPTADNVYINLNQNIEVRENTSYVYTFKAKATNAGSASFYPNGWVNTTGSIKLTKGTYDWTEFTSYYTTAEGETSITAMITCSDVTTEILIDEITLKEVGKTEDIMPNGTFEENGNESENFRAHTAAVDNYITRMLDNAEKNDLMADVLIQPGTFSRLAGMYPDVAEPSCGVGYDINSDIAKEALDLYVKTVMERIKDHPALLSVCISNEPNYDTRTDAENLDDYQAYLEELYNGDISALKSAYELEELSSFEDVEFPDDTRNRKFYEWVMFNNSFMSGWNSYVAGLVEKYAPDVPVHSKIMSLFGNSNSVKWGIDPEKFNEFTDFSGNDCYGFIENSNGLISKLMWYDLLKSIAPDKPIINSEDHIIIDGSTNYSKNNTTHVGADAWQGALHGRNASILWIWNRNSSEDSTTYGNILYRPDAVSLVGKRSLDLNRLSAEVDAFSGKENHVTILWSDTSFIYGTQDLLSSYKAALFAGANPNFITESQLIAGEEPSGVLVIPGSVNVRNEAFEKIKAYAANGGKVWAVGESCLTKTEKNTSVSGSVAFEKTIDTSNAKAEFETLLNPIVWDDEGNSLENVEIMSVNDADATFVNLCSYDWAGTKNVNFSGVAINLLTNEKYKGSITILPYVPVLLKITDSWYEFDAVQDDENPLNLTVNLKNKSMEDLFGKIYFKVFDKDGNLLNAVVYDNKLMKDGKVATATYGYVKNDKTYKAEAGVVIDGEEYSETFYVE